MVAHVTAMWLCAAACPHKSNSARGGGCVRVCACACCSGPELHAGTLVWTCVTQEGCARWKQEQVQKPEQTRHFPLAQDSTCFSCENTMAHVPVQGATDRHPGGTPQD